MRAGRRQQSQYPTLTEEDIASLKDQIGTVLAETFKAAVEMSVHFQVSSVTTTFGADDTHLLVASPKRVRAVWYRFRGHS